ncbi:prolyl 3-hydroxylase 3-like [Amblyomma americanum]
MRDQPPHCDRQFLDVGIRLARDEVCLNGPMRLVADEMLTQEECDVLLKLGETGRPGNGYNKAYPTTQHELFTGVMSSNVLQGLKNSSVSAATAKLLLLASDRARLYVEAYFRLKSRLHMHFVHVVCRTAERSSTMSRSDMSHPIHSDNCQYQENGTCLPRNEHLAWRDFSAAIYLNDDIHGGEMVLATSPRTSVRAVIRPKCGRMVAFSSRNPHGVLPVFSGRRCGLLMWMTHTEAMAEKGWLTLADSLGYFPGDGYYRNGSRPR